jgi:HK97 family phage major capsid protein
VSRASELARRAQDIFIRADEEDRELTPGERADAQSLIDRAESACRLEKTLRELGAGAGDAFPGGSRHHVAGYHSGDPGAAFVRSDGYKAVRSPGSRGASWSTGMIDVGGVGVEAKGTLLEGAGGPGAGTGGGLVPVPTVVPGVAVRLFQPLTLESLLLSGQTNVNTVRYAVEGTATSGAAGVAGVAEGGMKPESTLAYSTTDEPIKKIATSLTVSDELLEDANAVSAFVSSRLSAFVNIETERQLFRGAAGGNEIQGILTSRGVPVYAGGTAAGTKAEQLFKAINGVRGSAFVEPEWVVLHPTDWQDLRLLKDTANQYLGGGLFLSPYGGQGQVDASGQVTGAIDQIWGKSVYVTSAIGGAGTALVGTTAGGQVWNNGGLTVEASSSHASYFTSNLVALRAERRGGLTLLRPGAYVEVRLA